MMAKLARKVLFAALLSTLLLPDVADAARRRRRPPREREESQAEVVNLVSSKSWFSSRWYLVGRWSPGEIEWLTGEKTRFDMGDECVEGQYSKIRHGGENEKKLEVLHGRSDEGDWVAIELDPESEKATFDFECGGSFKVAYSWSGGEGLAPLLFLGPDRNEYFGYEFRIDVPDKGGRADIQLDLLLGAGRAGLPNAQPNGTIPGSTSLWLLPVGMARAEALFPFFKAMGATASLEQSITSFGGAQTTDTPPKVQSLLYSDWSAGLFFQYVIPVFEGILLRGHGKYYQHLVDEKADFPSAVSRDGKYLLLGGTLGIFFAKRFMVGGDFEYGLPNSLAGTGFKQSLINATARIGFRVSSFMVIMLEGGYRVYGIHDNPGVSSETLLLGRGGVRLEL